MKKSKQIILIIDDDPVLIQGTRDNLLGEGFDIIEAYDGITGFKLAKKHLPDLIILDAMMPNLDGFKVCKMLKGDTKTKDIKVMMYTSQVSTPEGEDKARSLADAFIVKSIKFIELLNMIKSLI